MGRKVPELDDPNIRELIFRNYRLIYRIMGDKIQIVRVFHGSRILEF
ncbi:MAG: type II toxin-antitoxin system RelE/ParE family toxin [Promethearchaeota archaeon]|nr:MAG: type II toxin-antitoxin system RelE/ParE family toxin [Candidatus Lokiarchaeota archaeon]